MSYFKFLERFYSQNKPLCYIIIFCFALFSLLRIPSFIEANWYGDEGVYQVIGEGLRTGRAMYVGVFDNKPPLLFAVYKLFSDMFWVKIASYLFGVASIFSLFFLAKFLFKKETAVAVSLVVFSTLFGLPLLEGNIANAENFMLPLTILSQLLVFYAAVRKERYLFVAGILFSLAFLIKIVAIFDFLAAFTFLSLYTYGNKQKLASLIPDKTRIVFLTGFTIPILVTFVYFLIRGTFPLFWEATFSSNIGYVNVESNFIVPLGLLFIKSIFLSTFILLLFFYRKNLSNEKILIYLWVAFTLFSAFFSERPYTHYLLMFLPAFSLLVGSLFEDVNKKIWRAALVTLIILVVERNFIVFERNIAYYQNYFSFVFGSKSVENYQSFFDRNTPTDYNLGQLVSVLYEDQEVFVWGDRPQVYTLIGKQPPGRYSVAYHILFYPDGIVQTKNALDNVKPKAIIKLKDFEEGLILRQGYKLRYQMDNVKIYEREA